MTETRGMMIPLAMAAGRAMVRSKRSSLSANLNSSQYDRHGDDLFGGGGRSDDGGSDDDGGGDVFDVVSLLVGDWRETKAVGRGKSC